MRLTLRLHALPLQCDRRETAHRPRQRNLADVVRMVQAVIVDGEHADKPVAQQDRHELPTLVLAASVRHPLHIIEAAKAGADIATVPFKVVEQVAKQPLTDKSIESFQEDWRRFTQETGGR